MRAVPVAPLLCYSGGGAAGGDGAAAGSGKWFTSIVTTFVGDLLCGR
jgi:hypothetical protein